MTMWQFEDIPQIGGTDPDCNALLYKQSWASLTDEGYYFDTNGHGITNLGTIQRYLTDEGPICPNLLQPRMSVQSQSFRYYEQPWPASGMIRNVSPDCTSASGMSSCGTQNEHRSPHMYPSHPYTNPVEYTPSSVSYLPADFYPSGSFLPETSVLSSTVVDPRDVEYKHEALELEPAVENNEDISLKQETTCDHGHSAIKPEGTSTYSGYADSGIGHSVRDAESVQPDSYEEPASDSDYNPSGRSCKRKRSSASNSSSGRTQRKRSNARKDSAISDASGPTKKSRRTSNASKSAAEAITNTTKDRRPFPCPLAGYGCTSNFSSKNEWKRHVATQHIKLIKWRCDLCAPSTDPKDNPKDENSFYYNEFNRKDLFTQHLRRMHAAPKEKMGRTHKEYPVNEDNLAEHQERCILPLRSAPQQSSCLLCPRTFSGPVSWDERMEHIGRHLEKDIKNNLDMLDSTSWKVDLVLETYLLEEGLINQVDGEWQIGDGAPRRPALVDSDEESEED